MSTSTSRSRKGASSLSYSLCGRPLPPTRDWWHRASEDGKREWWYCDEHVIVNIETQTWRVQRGGQMPPPIESKERSPA